MRNFSPTTAAYFAQRRAFLGHILVWVTAKNRTTGAAETIGFWTGADNTEFVIDGQTRLYFGAGAFLGMDPIRRSTGLKVKTQRLTLSQISTAGQQLIRGYDPRHAPIEVHRALFDPASELLIDEPHVILRGFVDRVSLVTPPKNESGGQISIEVATHGRALTRTLSRYRSDATLRERAPTDGFRKYSSISDIADTPWGRNAASSSGTREAEKQAARDALVGKLIGRRSDRD